MSIILDCNQKFKCEICKRSKEPKHRIQLYYWRSSTGPSYTFCRSCFRKYRDKNLGEIVKDSYSDIQVKNIKNMLDIIKEATTNLQGVMLKDAKNI